MIASIIGFSIRHKLIIIFFVIAWVAWGVYSLTKIPIGAVPDVTNNQVQVLTTSRNLSTLDIEQFITYPVELELSNLPGVEEIRSISKFGLSVVTVVFKDDMGTYLPRQLIAEKLKSAIDNIPEGFGSPEMGPITTGLGEIYQYVLDVEPGYEQRYSTMDLRTIQDWIVKRQLSGIPGVVEVNTWGGFLKQYEVAIDPEKLKAMDITMREVYEALLSNNDITGGGYIERNQESYFIRGEGLIGSLPDLEKVVVKNRGGVPVFVRDISEVRMGHATRFGAITGNAQGEKVMGQVMMLKNANSSEVIKEVKSRVAAVQESLPAGIVINPFLERTELINKTTLTVTENLTLGALIVIFVLVLLLGNWRSGLIVASVIPLALLFGISMMNLFGISANLMSLGAIDFGIIIDGAVIIIEYVVFQVNQHRQELLEVSGSALRDLKDRLTLSSTIKMMQPAFFGQIIILIVFIPILSLTGVEGKMFKPMALSFGFALLGAMILCLTYIPVMASIVCRPSQQKHNISQKIMEFIQSIYSPIIDWALHSKKVVVGLASALLILSLVVFSNLGGEFVPTLDEGDFVVQPVLKTGTSLSKTIDIVTEIEGILIDEFPEVEQVVTRIGAAEVPTDPMSMEETDVIIKLKPKKQWTSAKGKEELADKMKVAMSAIPGIDFEFTQPIEMRFNELITGVRTDVAVKIYGEDLDVLYQLANKVSDLIENVPGAADINVEKTAGLPQMSIAYNREKIAQYGINIRDLNQMVRMAFGGESAGVIMEGERRFDLVVRLQEDFRKDISNLQRLYVDLPNGKQVPLNEVAAIDYQTGPAKISRDNAKRRIVIGINVRNRDVESVVNEIESILREELAMPPGYYITYGGQFENLQKAKKRLALVVPVALALIFIMLYVTFKSVSQALLVFSAIPLAAIGGVLMLWIRDMPFSISAGIGFIALFGIAVLNGIVLIEYFNELEKSGITNIHQRVLQGTKIRLRPVLLTASAAALGFLPMAYSTSAGAEVQRPLASVVVGGLITATFLTLVVLPVLYTMYKGNKQKPKGKVLTNAVPKLVILIALIGLSSNGAQAQKRIIDLPQAQEIALENNLDLQAAGLRTDRQKSLQKMAFNAGNTQLYYSYDENNIADNGTALNVYGIQQSFSLPHVYSRRSKLFEKQTELSELQLRIREADLIKGVSQAYYELQHLNQRLNQLIYLDSLYGRFAGASNRRFELGETDYLVKLTAEARHLELNTLVDQARLEVDISHHKLASLLQLDQEFEIALEELIMLNFDSSSYQGFRDNNPAIQYYQRLTNVAEARAKVEKSLQWPQIRAEYFLGRSQGEGARSFDGYQFGLGIPLIGSDQRAKVQASRIDIKTRELEAVSFQRRWESRYRQLSAELQKYQSALRYYQSNGLSLSREIVRMAHKSYQSGESGYLQYIQSLESARQINLSYLDNLHGYNQTVLEIQYLVNP